MPDGQSVPGHFIEWRPAGPSKATIPSGAWTAARTDAAQTFTGVQTMTSPVLTTPTITNPTISGTACVSVTSASVTLGSTHVGRTVVLDRATGIAVTLPAASGTGDVYKLFVKTTFTGASTVKVANTTDVMSGTAILSIGNTTGVGMYPTTVSDDTIDLLGTANTTGGMLGETIFLLDVAAGVWSVEITSDAANSPASPFSATV